MEIALDDGGSVVGECAPLPEMGGESSHHCRETLDALQLFAKHRSPEELLQQLDSYRDHAPAACCGVEAALVTLMARQSRLPLNRWMSPDAPATVRVNQMVGTLDNPVIDPEGSTILKLKVGISPLKDEIEQLHKFAATIPQQSKIRLDANQAWSMKEATELINAINSLPIESIEEPLQCPTLEKTQQLQEISSFPIALDESAAQFGIAALLQERWLQRVVLKPTLMSGPWTTFRIARQFQERGVAVVITSALESSIGILSAAHCAAAVDPQQIEAHGLATSSWLAEDLSIAPVIKNGILSIL